MAAKDDSKPIVDWLTLAETAEILKCSEWKVRALYRAGRLEAVKFDHQWRVPKHSLQKLLNEIFTGPKP